MKRLATQHANTSERKRQIVEAALSCFNEFGVTEAAMSDICSRSRTSIGSIYHHFKSKEQLAAAVYIEGIRSYQEGYLSSLEKQKSASDGIETVVRYHLEWVVGNREWSQYLFKEGHAKFLGETRDMFRELNKTFFRRNIAWFQPFVDAGVLKELPPDIFYSILLGPCQAFAKQHLFHQTRSEVETAVEAITEAVWQALKNNSKQ